MNPERYVVTESDAGFLIGETLTVIEQAGHANEMVLELDPFAADPTRVIVSECMTGFSERNIFEPGARFGDWHEFSLAFDPELTSTGAAAEADGPVQLSMGELSSIAEPVETAS